MPGALDSLVGVAADLTQQLGTSVTLYRPTNAYDAEAGKTYRTWAEHAAVVTPPEDFTRSRIDGTLIQQGDTVVNLAARDSPIGKPTDEDEVEFGGARWSIVQVGEVWTGEKIAVYTLHLRR